MRIKTGSLEKSTLLFYCPRCKENKVCPRGGCESELVGEQNDDGVLVPFNHLPKKARGKKKFVDNWE